MEKHYKYTFDKIKDEKRSRILEAAINEFSEKGFSNANINVIANNAKISIGSMYNYFASKDDLYLTVINRGFELLEIALSEVDLVHGDIFDKFENLLIAAQKYSYKYQKLTQMYLDMTTQGLAHLSKRLSKTMETITAKYYQSLLLQGQKDGIVDPDIDINVFSFCIDNLMIVLQFSYTSEYFKDRMKIFIGEDAHDNGEMVISGIMQFIRHAIKVK